MAQAWMNDDQLKLAIAQARTGEDGQPQTSEQLIQHIIGLYGAELQKANDEVRRQRDANDELFRIKQRVVIANRDLMRQLVELREPQLPLPKDSPTNYSKCPTCGFATIYKK